MTAKIDQGKITPGCELENYAFAAMLAEMRRTPNLLPLLSSFEVSAACENRACETHGECPRLDALHIESDATMKQLVRLERAERILDRVELRGEEYV